MILRLLNVQGIAGIAVSLALGVMLIVQKGETHHWMKMSAGFEQLYRQDQAAFATTVANYRAAADAARAADQANLTRVAAEQRAITERTSNDFETRLAATRAAAQRLRLNAQAATDTRAGGGASMPGASHAASALAQAAGKDEFSLAERELATEQAIQLDDLIKWIRAQTAVDNNGRLTAR
jgi:hypothetical protein